MTASAKQGSRSDALLSRGTSDRVGRDRDFFCWHIASVSAEQRHSGVWGQIGSNQPTVKTNGVDFEGERKRSATSPPKIPPRLTTDGQDPCWTRRLLRRESEAARTRREWRVHFGTSSCGGFPHMPDKAGCRAQPHGGPASGNFICAASPQCPIWRKLLSTG